jgi:hypothetical protein
MPRNHDIYFTFFLDFRQRRNQQPAEEMLLLPIHGPKFNQENMRFFVNYKKDIFRYNRIDRESICTGPIPQSSILHPLKVVEFSKKYWAKGSASPRVDLRFCPWVLLKY